MRLYIEFQYSGKYYHYGLLNGCDYSRIELPDVFIIDVFKYNNHSYHVKALFYNNPVFYDFRVRSKSKLYTSIQDLLQHELSDV